MGFVKKYSDEMVQASYHESGHTVIAYFCGYSVNSINILMNENNTVKMGITNYNFSGDEEFLKIIVSRNEEVTDFGKIKVTVLNKNNTFSNILKD